ncbi:large-conductance mechanosensitive channel protein MscL [Solimonas sp. SE-A11]|uniref:large-conductance mechanosensitive channel protein MscL n=1 Tax=Solimonas sp. SE-A11 TaxID=3054954 RepID=UPI00259C9AEB|nr:large-conductance mechanosensitive channel protein MscL [Solimonas sp. SE-A11]MDM4772662.1 large-conductance mechanosensitive channel protein MscL [Solimonas sp. SE-A11]
MSMMSEFRQFAMRGNVVDLAVGVVIGAAFGKIVSSLVADIIMPPLGLALAGIDFSKLGWVLKDAVGDTPAVVLAYGKFIQVCFDFAIIAFVIFMLVKGINRLRHQEAAKPAEPPAPTAQEKLLMEIRDLLKK